MPSLPPSNAHEYKNRVLLSSKNVVFIREIRVLCSKNNIKLDEGEERILVECED